MIKSDFNRRRFLELAAGSFLGVSSSNLFGAAGEKSSVAPLEKPAKQLVYLYMQGGMSHIDTFDLKTGHENQGSTTPINTNADGIRVSSHLPGLAKQADKLCIVNSLTSTAGDHEKGNYFMHTSYQQRATIRHPGLGRGITSSKANLTPRSPPPYSLAVKVDFTEAEVFSNPNSNHWPSRNRNPDSNTQGPW